MSPALLYAIVTATATLITSITALIALFVHTKNANQQGKP